MVLGRQLYRPRGEALSLPPSVVSLCSSIFSIVSVLGSSYLQSVSTLFSFAPLSEGASILSLKGLVKIRLYIVKNRPDWSSLRFTRSSLWFRGRVLLFQMLKVIDNLVWCYKFYKPLSRGPACGFNPPNLNRHWGALTAQRIDPFEESLWCRDCIQIAVPAVNIF